MRIIGKLAIDVGIAACEECTTYTTGATIKDVIMETSPRWFQIEGIGTITATGFSGPKLLVWIVIDSQ